MSKLIVAMAVLLAGTGSVWAACPPEATSSAAEAIDANQRRIICLQQEAAADSRQRQLEQNLNSLETSIQSIQLQRRFDALPKIPVYVPPPVPVFGAP